MRKERKGEVRRRMVLTCLALCVAMFSGWLLRGVGGGTSGSPSPAAAAPAAELESRSGVPVGFPQTREGAAAAAAAYQRAFASPSILRPGVLRERIEAVATPGYVAQMLAANRGIAGLRAGPIGTGLADGLQTIYAATPIGYAVRSFEPNRASILTWGFTLLGNAESVEPAAYFGTSTTELVWTSDGWRIASTRSGFGPTPRLATEPVPGGGFAVLRLARELRSYELAP